jgi:hypothetical protein
MEDMIQALSIEGGNMIVVQLVEHLPPFLLPSHEMHLPQAAQMVRHGRLADADSLGKGSDAPLPVHQGRDQADAAGVAEGPEEFGDPGGGALLERAGGWPPWFGDM